MQSKGFTIIELVISIFVLSVGVVGVFSAFSMMVILTADTADRLTATYLAQEGMEIVRNIRDNNWLKKDVSWTEGLTTVGACSDVNTGCRADYTSPSMSGGYDVYLYLNKNNNFYDYDITGTKTKFRRKILIDTLPDLDQNILKVTVSVFWDQKPTILNFMQTTGSITTEETLYNWY